MAYQPAGYPPPQHRGLGVAALVLGIAAIITLLLCGLGAVVAIAGLVVGVIAAVQNNGRGMAVTGITLSAVTLVIAIGAGIWFFNRVSPCTDQIRYPTKADRDHCLQHRVPFFKATPKPMR
jgi:TRAP-type C4-dicarboxylate transport system permease small subunit